MYTSATCFKCNVVANDYKRISVKERVTAGDIFKVTAFVCSYNFIVFNTRICANSVNKLGCKDICFIANFNKAVFKICIKTDCKVGRKCPCCGCPDYEEYFFGNAVKHSFSVINGEFNVDCCCFIVLIFDFCFSKSCFTVAAPVNRFKTFINKSFFSHLSEHFNLFCNIVVVKSDVRMVPVAYYAETFKLLSLCINILKGKFTAGFTEFNNTCLCRIDTQLFNCLFFNRQTVSIPTRNIRSFEAAHILISYDNILKYFVHCMTQVYVSVCIRRAVMKNV